MSGGVGGLKFEGESLALGDFGPGGDHGDAEAEMAPRLVLAEQD